MKTLITPEALNAKDEIDNFSVIYQFYGFTSPESEIVNFIKEHNLLSYLLVAPWEIKRVFGNDIILNLELHHDSEINWSELFIVIKSNLSPEVAVELESKLFEEWFVKIWDKVKGRLNFTEEPL